MNFHVHFHSIIIILGKCTEFIQPAVFIQTAMGCRLRLSDIH